MARLYDDQCGESIQTGTRPILVISNDKCNEHSPVITVLPLTSKLRKNPLPTHVLIEGCGTVKKSIILAEQVLTLSKRRLGKRMGSIGTEYQTKVDQAIKIQLSV